eukprot:1126290-Prymnesium_polylepis.1
MARRARGRRDCGQRRRRLPRVRLDARPRLLLLHTNVDETDTYACSGAQWGESPEEAGGRRSQTGNGTKRSRRARGAT